MLTLHRSLKHVARVASKESSRYALTGVHVVAKGKRARVSATDGKSLIEVTAPTIPAADLPTIEGFDAGANGAREAIVPTDAYKEAFKPLKAGVPCCRETLAVTLQPERVTLASTDLATSRVSPVTPIEGKYPDFAHVFPEGPSTYAVVFDARRLGETLLAIADILEDAGESNRAKKYRDQKPPAVLLEFFSPEKPVRISAGDPLAPCGTISALVMPLVIQNPLKRWARK